MNNKTSCCMFTLNAIKSFSFNTYKADNFLFLLKAAIPNMFPFARPFQFFVFFFFLFRRLYSYIYALYTVCMCLCVRVCYLAVGYAARKLLLMLLHGHVTKARSNFIPLMQCARDSHTDLLSFILNLFFFFFVCVWLGK